MTYQNSPTQPEINSITNKSKLVASTSSISPFNKPPQKSSGLSLKTKIISSAIALGVIPVAIIGAVAYQITQSHTTRNIEQIQQERTHHLAMMFENFIADRINEAETLTGSPIFTNPNVMGTVTVNQKKSALNTFQEQTDFYDSIVYLDLQGNPLFQSQSEYPLSENYSDRDYFRKAIQNKQTTLNEMGISSLTGKPRVEFAVPVKNAWTNEVVGIMRFRIPSQQIIPIFSDYVTSNEQWHLINSRGVLFASMLANLNNQPLANYFSEIQSAHATKQIVSESVNNPSNPTQEQIINYAPINLKPANSDLNVGTAIALDKDLAFAALKPLRWIYLGGTIGTALLVGSIAGFLANKIIEPLLKLTSTVNKLGQGKLDTRIKLTGQDELTVLGDRLNHMAQQLNTSIESHKTIAHQSQLMVKISQAYSLRDLQLPFSSFLAEVRSFLAADRVIFYQFDRQWQGTVIAESVTQDLPRTLGVTFNDPCFAREYVRKYQGGRIQAVTDIHQANLTACHLRQLESYQVKASLVLPVILPQTATSEPEKLIGLLIAHQCSEPRVWEQADIDYFQHTADRLSMVLKGYIYAREQNWNRADFHQNLSGILERLNQVAQGDLRSDIDAATKSDAMKSFDRAIATLAQTVRNIKVPTRQTNQQLKTSQHEVTQLKECITHQTNQLALVFAFVEQLTNSIAEISSHIGTTSVTVDSVVGNLESEKANFARAIALMSELDASLRANTDKVKNLDRASQKMSKVINSIRKINLRASLLTSKLSKRVPINDSTYGLQEEIKSIQQSIAATKELENVVYSIEREIAEVLREYKAKENHLEQNNYLAANASDNLEQIAITTRDIQQDLFSLVNMTKIQMQTFQKINGLKAEIDETSSSILTLSDRTINSLAKTSLTARDLENVINFFKLESNLK